MSEAGRRRLGWMFAAACALLIAAVLSGDLRAEDNWDHEKVNIDLGLWSTRFLIAAFAVTPLSQVLREPALKRMRRPLGLGAAVFTAVHAVQYLLYSRAWPHHMGVLFRPYLSIGTVGAILLIPLAATSCNAAVRRLGPKRWKSLHRLLYLAAPLAVLHELMAWSNPFGEVGVHAVLMCALLGWRAAPVLRRAWPRAGGGGRAAGGLPAE